MWQWLVIAPAIVLSAVYAVWKLMPASSRLRLARWFSRRAKQGPGWLSWLGQRLERAALPTGSCESCPASRVGPGQPGQRKRGS